MSKDHNVAVGDELLSLSTELIDTKLIEEKDFDEVKDERTPLANRISRLVTLISNKAANDAECGQDIVRTIEGRKEQYRNILRELKPVMDSIKLSYCKTNS